MPETPDWLSELEKVGGNERPFQCRCVWHGVRCEKDSTQEDGLCDWCGVRRPEDMEGNPFANFNADGEYTSLSGGTVTGYNHQAGWGVIPDSVRPTACWMERS